jgi:hypothetical protein
VAPIPGTPLESVAIWTWERAYAALTSPEIRVPPVRRDARAPTLAPIDSVFPVFVLTPSCTEDFHAGRSTCSGFVNVKVGSCASAGRDAAAVVNTRSHAPTRGPRPRRSR